MKPNGVSSVSVYFFRGYVLGHLDHWFSKASTQAGSIKSIWVTFKVLGSWTPHKIDQLKINKGKFLDTN